GTPPHSVVNPPALKGQPGKSPSPVNPSSPPDMADGVVFPWPLLLEHRFGFAVSLLLFPVAGDRISPMMPDDRARIEPDCPAHLLQAPANVHVVPSDPELGVKPTYGFQAAPPEGAIASGNVLCHMIQEENMHRPTWSVGYAVGDSVI